MAFAVGGDGMNAGSNCDSGRGVVGPSRDLSVIGEGGDDGGR